MREPALLQPESIEECLTALAHHGAGAKIVAGSTAVTIMLRQRLIEPDVLLSISKLQELKQITVDDNVLTLGALTSHAEVEREWLVRTRVPVLARSFAVVGNVRVRSAATVGGVMAEADYASDPPSALLALDAVVVTQSTRGSRAIPVADFFRGFYETALEDDELITAIQVALPPAGTSSVYKKFRTRSSEDRPCIGVAVALRCDDGGRCEDIRVAVGAASETPVRLSDVEASVLGTTLTPDIAAEVGEAYAMAIRTLDDARGSADYRREMIRIWVRRAILEAVHARLRE